MEVGITVVALVFYPFSFHVLFVYVHLCVCVCFVPFLVFVLNFPSFSSIVLSLLYYEEYITDDRRESWRPILSKDNRYLYYIAKKSNTNFDIYQYDTKEQKEINITNSIKDEWDPCISPDNSTMVYASKKNGNWDLILLDLKSLKKTKLTSSIGDEWDPSFSNDGRHIYFAANYGLRNGIYRYRLK